MKLRFIGQDDEDARRFHEEVCQLVEAGRSADVDSRIIEFQASRIRKLEAELTKHEMEKREVEPSP
jgi:hypothetical protein